MEIKLKWQTVNRAPKGRWLKASWPEDEYDVNLLFWNIQEWCDQNKCGVRMSYDMWKFRSKAEVTAFLLRWS